MSHQERTPSLQSLRAFEAGARHGSFLRAAEELRVTPTAISHQIRSLEDRLGVALFHRRRRGVELTAAGVAMASTLTQAFSDIAASVEKTRQRGSTSEVRIACSPSFAAKWLVPRLGSFRARHPDVEIRILSSSLLVDLIAGEADIALRHGRGPVPGCRVEKLIDAMVVPVCSPALRYKAGVPKVKEDLARHVLLHDSSGDVGRLPGWADWLEAQGVAGIDPRRGPRFNNSHLVIDAALAGEGVALAVAALVERDLVAGRLVAPISGPMDASTDYRLVVSTTLRVDAPVRKLCSWLKQEARSTRTQLTRILDG